MWSSPRLAMTQASPRTAWPPLGGGRGRRRSSRSLPRAQLGSAIAVAGEREEDVVERRLAQAEVVDLEPVLVGSSSARAAPRAGRRRWGPAPCATRGRPSARRRDAADVAAAVVEPLRVATVTTSWAPPTWRFSGPGVASGDDPAVVDHHDVVREAVGLLEVLGGQQDGRPRPPASRARPTARCGRAGPARWSARRGTAPRAGRRASRPGRGGGACRRSRSSRGARRRRRGELLQQLVGARPRRAAPRWWSSPIITRFSRPVSRPSTVASCAARPSSRRTRRRPRHVEPATRAEPASGRVSVVRMRTAVVLPAPFGPEQTADGPAGRRSRRRPARSCRRSA